MFLWPVALALAALDATGLYLLAGGTAFDAAPAQPPTAPPLPPKPIDPLPPAMIDPPPVATALQSGILMVVSKPSQHMFVFSDGVLWGSTPVSTGKRRHETPSGVFPILQKRRFHRSNIYSNAPMPYMQRLTWDGIALHAGRVPGYAASHGCVRIPPAFAQSLFKLTNASKTTVVIGDDPLESEAHAQQFALTAQLPIRSALAPPPDTRALAALAMAQLETAIAMFGLPTQPVPEPSPSKAPPKAPAPPPAVAPPASPRPLHGETIQLAASPSQAEAEAHWARLLRTQPALSRFQKTVEPATVNALTVVRLRISGAGAHDYCTKLKSEGISCLNVNF